MKPAFSPVLSKSAIKREKRKIAADKHKAKVKQQLENPEGPQLIRPYIKSGLFSSKNKFVAKQKK